METNTQKYYEARERALKYLPNPNCILLTHDATDISDPTFITYEDEEMNALFLTTPLGKLREKERKFLKAGLTSINNDYTFDTFHAEYQFQKIMKYLAMKYIKQSEDEWLGFFGTTGSGKTHLCTAITRELIMSDKEVHYIMWVEEINRVKFDIELYNKWVKKLKQCNILVIDDLLKEGISVNPTEFEMKALFEIINYRYSNHLKTIISSERSINELQRMNKALMGRIIERCQDYLIEIPEKEGELRNYRLRKKNA